MAEPSRLLQWRQERGWTQQHCADLAGVSVGHWSHIEAGRREVPPAAKVKIARRLGARVRDLFDVESLDADRVSA